MTEPYRPQAYWEERLSGNLGLTTVGHSGLGRAYNEWLYRARFRAMRRALRAAGVEVRNKSLVEVGVGSGAWIPFWQSRGVAHLTGLDITSVSVRTLQDRYPGFAFEQVDIGGPLPSGLEARADLVTAFDVLFHITDDAAFAQAIANLADLLRPGGYVILSDGFADTPWGPIYHEYHRSYAQYRAEMEKHRLKRVHVEPIFFTMTTTLAGGDPPGVRWFARISSANLKVVARLAAHRVTAPANYVVGLVAYTMDGILCRIGQRRPRPQGGGGPSLNILIARKE